VIVSLHRPADRDEGSAAGHLGCQGPDAFGAHSGDSAGPIRRLRHSVGRTQQIGPVPIPAVAVGLEELFVVVAGNEQGVRQAEHDCRVGGRADRDPLRLHCLDEVFAQRR
jgi:hypothetical protein